MRPLGCRVAGHPVQAAHRHAPQMRKGVDDHELVPVRRVFLEVVLSSKCAFGRSILRPMTPLARSWIRTGIVLLIGLAPLSAKAANTYYVAPTGSDSAAGTMAAPFATLQKANDTAAAGDTILLRAGTYNCTAQITLSKSGTSDTNRTKIWAYPGEVPVLDFSNFTLASETSDHPAITVTGNWMHLRGLEIANGKVGTSGSHSYSLLRTKNASNNTFELLNIHQRLRAGAVRRHRHRRQPDSELRFARQLRRQRQPGGWPERRRVRRSLSNHRPQHHHQRVPCLEQLR